MVNPVSGGKEKQEWETKINEYFKDKPHTTQIFLLTGGNDTTSIRHHLSSFQPERVVAVGGDGTVRMVADILKETDTPLCILPAGSANGMAKELNIPPDINTALDIVATGKVKKISLVKINEEHISIHLSDVGLNAMIIKYYDRFDGRGWLTYAKALWKVIWRKPKFQCTISTDSEQISRKAYMIILANATKYGMGAVVNPTGDLYDSVFEVIVVRKLNVFAAVNSLFKQKEFHPTKVEVFKTQTVEITTQRKQHFQVDGEYHGKQSKITARLLSGILNIVVPA